MKKSLFPKELFQYERLLDEQKWDLDGISFPISFTEIEKFFRQNETLKITINIYQLSRSLDFAQESKFSLINVFHHNAGSSNLNLLLIKQYGESGANEISHFFYIRDLNKFVAKRYGRWTIPKRSFVVTSSPASRFICHSCLFKTSSEAVFVMHRENCNGQVSQKKVFDFSKDYLEYESLKENSPKCRKF